MGGKEPTSDGLYKAEEALRVDCVLVEGDYTLWVKPVQQSLNCWLLKGTTAESWSVSGYDEKFVLGC